jgi:hypothetical protein
MKTVFLLITFEGQEFNPDPTMVFETQEQADQFVKDQGFKTSKILELPFEISLGAMSNQMNSLGSKIVEMRVRLPELEKQARKTPPKTLLTEVAKVKQAKESLKLCKEQLESLEIEHKSIREHLKKFPRFAHLG